MTQSSRVLATRCPHCHTVFRVVADQLKLRDGLVRCGNCREVFDGRAYLCDPPAEDSEGPVISATSAHDVASDNLAPTNAPPQSDSHTDSARDPHQNVDRDGAAPRDLSGNGNASTSPASAASAVPPIIEPAPVGENLQPPQVPEMLTPTAIAALLGTPDESRAQLNHGPGRYIDDDPTVLTAPTASPLRTEAQSSSSAALQEKRPGAARVVWRILMALAILGLLAQWAWIERAALVDRAPALRGLFSAVGRPMHVTIAPPRQPDMIQISSVTLVTNAPGTDDATQQASDNADNADHADSTASAVSATSGDTVPMTLTVFVRNQADYAVAWPSLELTLSDIDGKPVVRRVFSANDYVAESALREAGLAPRNERTIRLRLSAQAALVSNYRVLAFYP